MIQINFLFSALLHSTLNAQPSTLNSRLSPPSEAEEIQATLIRKMTPGRRLEIAQSLYHIAWQFKASWLRTQHPDWTEAEVQRSTRLIFVTGHARA